MDGLTVKPNGKLIRDRRLSKGWTQDHLARVSSINERTVQRAEDSAGISRETAAQIAASLGLTVGQITVREELSDDQPTDHSTDANLVVLHRTESARQVIEGLCKSEKHVIDYDVDPTTESVEDLASLVEMLEALAPFQDPPFDDPLSNLASRIRFTAKFAAKITQLAEHGINIFYGTYVVIEKRPSWDQEMQCWATRLSQQPEPMTVGMVLLSENQNQKVLRRVQDTPFIADEVDEDIPF
jgi:transcriptional regulator with XRE-family HTH domain